MATEIGSAVLPGSDQPNLQAPCFVPAPPKVLSGTEVGIGVDDGPRSGPITEHPPRDRVQVVLHFAGVGFLARDRPSGKAEQRELIGPHVYVIPPGTAHFTCQESRAERFYVYLDQAVWQRRAGQNVPDVMIIESALYDSITWRFAYIIRELYYSREEPDSMQIDLVGNSLALRLGRLISGAPVSLGRRLTPEQWQRTISYMMSDPKQKLQVADFARRACLSPQHFTELFTNTAGESPYQFRIRLRMLKAHALLMEVKLPWKAVADAVGYGDAHEFSKVFRSFWGYSVHEVLASVPGASAPPPE